jgi:Tol biopolymer transport system component
MFSPDSRWLAYGSNPATTGGPPGIFVEPFPATGAKYQLARIGSHATWSRDGKQMFYASGPPPIRLMAVDVRMTPGFTFGTPMVIESPEPANLTFTEGWYDVSPDGSQFVIVVAPQTDATSQQGTRQVNVVLNWMEELKRLVPAN